MTVVKLKIMGAALVVIKFGPIMLLLWSGVIWWKVWFSVNPRWNWQADLQNANLQLHIWLLFTIHFPFCPPTSGPNYGVVHHSHDVKTCPKPSGNSPAMPTMQISWVILINPFVLHYSCRDFFPRALKSPTSVCDTPSRKNPHTSRVRAARFPPGKIRQNRHISWCNCAVERPVFNKLLANC